MTQVESSILKKMIGVLLVNLGKITFYFLFSIRQLTFLDLIFVNKENDFTILNFFFCTNAYIVHHIKS